MRLAAHFVIGRIVQGEKALGQIEFRESEGVREIAPEIEPGAEPPPAEG